MLQFSTISTPNGIIPNTSQTLLTMIWDKTEVGSPASLGLTGPSVYYLILPETDIVKISCQPAEYIALDRSATLEFFTCYHGVFTIFIVLKILATGEIFIYSLIFQRRWWYVSKLGRRLTGLFWFPECLPGVPGVLGYPEVLAISLKLRKCATQGTLRVFSR